MIQGGLSGSLPVVVGFKQPHWQLTPQAMQQVGCGSPQADFLATSFLYLYTLLPCATRHGCDTRVRKQVATVGSPVRVRATPRHPHRSTHLSRPPNFHPTHPPTHTRSVLHPPRPAGPARPVPVFFPDVARRHTLGTVFTGPRYRGSSRVRQSRARRGERRPREANRVGRGRAPPNSLTGSHWIYYDMCEQSPYPPHAGFLIERPGVVGGCHPQVASGQPSTASTVRNGHLLSGRLPSHGDPPRQQAPTGRRKRKCFYGARGND